MVDDYIQVKHGRKQPEVQTRGNAQNPGRDARRHGLPGTDHRHILNRLGGIELLSAYTCIKAISKKKHATIAKFREEFCGAQNQGLSKHDAEELFELVEKFAGYGFNKSHSTTPTPWWPT